MKPIKDKVLVKPIKGSSVSEGGIVVPETAMKPSNKVLIVEVGQGTSAKPMKLKKGQVGYRVKDYSMLDVHIEGELHYLLTQDSIIAVQ